MPGSGLVPRIQKICVYKMDRHLVFMVFHVLGVANQSYISHLFLLTFTSAINKTKVLNTMRFRYLSNSDILTLMDIPQSSKHRYRGRRTFQCLLWPQAQRFGLLLFLKFSKIPFKFSFTNNQDCWSSELQTNATFSEHTVILTMEACNSLERLFPGLGYMGQQPLILSGSYCWLVGALHIFWMSPLLGPVLQCSPTYSLAVPQCYLLLKRNWAGCLYIPHLCRWETWRQEH